MDSWRVRDPQGLVHCAVTVEEQILLYDNNVDFVERTLTLCELCAYNWPYAAPEDVTTCVACASCVGSW